MGNVLQGGEGQAPSRQAALGAGIANYFERPPEKIIVSCFFACRSFYYNSYNDCQQSLRVWPKSYNDGQPVADVQPSADHGSWRYGKHVQCSLLYGSRRSALRRCPAYCKRCFAIYDRFFAY